jgi:hypothetical protein
MDQQRSPADMAEAILKIDTDLAEISMRMNYGENCEKRNSLGSETQKEIYRKFLKLCLGAPLNAAEEKPPKVLLLGNNPGQSGAMDTGVSMG